jgi:hypothetical protein
MGTRSIPNCRRDSSQIPTHSSRPSRPSSDFILSSFSPAARAPNRNPFRARFAPLVPWAVGSPSKEKNFGFSVFNCRFPVSAPRRRVMGAWWPSRSSKPLSARFAGRGKFDSYPLRQFFQSFLKSTPGNRGNKKCIRKGGVVNVARANSQTDLALVRRWSSVQTQPKGSDAGLTSCS